ncbi:hypothetical protein [Terasakiella pusilla]|uniref:hypothetical protein n=1 Tax=Terasakiella pusilla TaxID=64973 RepID=UPI003AA9BE79
MPVEVLRELFLPMISIGLKLTLFVLALGLLRGLLRWFDNKMEFSFKDWINAADCRSVSIYLGCRFLGACLLLGFIFT